MSVKLTLSDGEQYIEGTCANRIISKENTMGNPLQDQLLKAGLVNKKQAQKAKREQYLNRKKKKKNDPTETGNKYREQQQAQAKHNRKLNQQRTEKKRLQEQKAQIKQLVEKNRLKLDGKGAPYYFAVQKQINRIFVSEEMADQLCRGQLAIVSLGSNFEVVPARVAHQIASRDKEVVVAFHEGGDAEDDWFE